MMCGTTLDVFGAISEALTNGDSESGSVQIGDITVGTVAPSGREIEAQNADLPATRKCNGGRIEYVRHRINAQGHGVGRMHKPRLPSQHGCKRPAIRIGDRNEDIRQQLEEAAMLIRHEVSDSGTLRRLT